MDQPHRDFFLEKYKDKTIADYDSIYWRGIGMARKSMTDNENINLTKFMNGWLNSGRQKGLFGQLSECPCCGWHEETQLHMFQCNNPEVKRNRKRAITLLEKYYHQHRIPATVYVPFIRVKAACEGVEVVWVNQTTPSTMAAIQTQQRLGPDFLLRGLLTKEWLAAIVRPEQRFKQLYIGLWRTVFASVWEKRNSISHSDDSTVTKLEREQLMTELCELGATQQYLIDYSVESIKQWTTASMRTTINLLVQAAVNFRQEQVDETQPRITAFFPVVSSEEVE